MRRLTRREQAIFLCCLIAVNVYVGSHSFVKPLRKKIKNVERQIRELKSQNAKDARVIRKAQLIEEKFQYYKKEFQQPASSEGVFSAMLAEIEKVAGESQIRIADLKPLRMVEETFYNRFPVSLTIDSPYEDVMEFLYVLQQPPYLYNAEDLRFDKAARRNTSDIKTRLVLSKIYLP